jgi:leucyl aminopeptidase (aminopeptidase T)
VNTIIRHLLAASLVDFRSLGKKAREIAAQLGEGTEATVLTPGSKIAFKLTATQEIEDGIIDKSDVESGSNVCYVPPGYVYVELDQKSVSGKFTISPTVTRFGLIKDATLEFKDGELLRWKSSASAKILGELVESASDASKRISSMTVGLNPVLKYGYGLNANSAGVIGLRVLGVNATTKQGSLMVEGKTIVAKGKL